MRALLVMLVLWPAVARAGDAERWRDVANALEDAVTECAENLDAIEQSRAKVVESSAEMIAQRDVIDALVPELEDYCGAFDGGAKSMKELVGDLHLCEACSQDPEAYWCESSPSFERCKELGPELSAINTDLQRWFEPYERGMTEALAAKDRIDELTQASSAEVPLQDLVTGCKAGEAGPCMVLGDRYDEGAGVKKSRKQAKKYWKKSVKLFDRDCQKRKDAQACGYLAKMYEDGDVATGKSKKKAKKYRALANKYDNGVDAYLAE